MESRLSIPTKCSGAAQIQLFLRYGDPEDTGFAERWIDQWQVQKIFPWFPEKIIQVHKHFRPLLEQAFQQLEEAGLHEEIYQMNEAFQIRPIRGSEEVLSLHSWGCAIDFNAGQNPLGCEGSWSEEFLQVMRDAQIYCGQDWVGRKDPMHFSMLLG